MSTPSPAIDPSPSSPAAAAAATPASASPPASSAPAASGRPQSPCARRRRRSWRSGRAAGPAPPPSSSSISSGTSPSSAPPPRRWRSAGTSGRRCRLGFGSAGYVAQCVLHMVCVGAEYWRRGRGESGGLSSPRLVPDQTYGSGEDLEEDNTSLAKHLENTNTMFSFIWWIIGFYWVSAGGQALTRDSPQLYGLCIVFLAFDVFFLVFCVALACIVGIAVCCCLPCIIAILYAVADQDGATDEDIRQLPKYKFRRIAESEKDPGETSGRFGGIMTESGSDPPIEHVLSAEDAECCICLSAYDDGVELRELPCGHHFHCACIDKWLYINATCPLCKYEILKSGSQGVEEV